MQGEVRDSNGERGPKICGGHKREPPKLSLGIGVLAKEGEIVKEGGGVAPAPPGVKPLMRIVR